MSKIAANLIRVYLNQFDLSGVLNAASLKVEQETPVVTCFSDTGPRRVVGNYDHNQSLTGLFEPTDDGYDEQLQALLGSTSDLYLTQTFGITENSIAYDALVRLASLPLSGQAGGAVMRSFEAAGSGGLSRGRILRSATVTGTGNGTGYNAGATTSGQTYRVMFRLLSFTGTNITMKVQESSDNGAGDAFADVTGLTSGALTAAGIVVVSTTAATEAYKRVVISGTITSATVLVTAGVVS